MTLRKPSKPLFLVAIALAICAASAAGIYFLFFTAPLSSATFGLTIVYADENGNVISEIKQPTGPLAVLWGPGTQIVAPMQQGYSFIFLPNVKINLQQVAIDPAADYTVKLTCVSTGVTDTGPAAPTLQQSTGYLSEKTFTVKGSALATTTFTGVGFKYIPCSFYLSEANVLTAGTLYQTKVNYTMKVDLSSAYGPLATATAWQLGLLGYVNQPDTVQPISIIITVSPAITANP